MRRYFAISLLAMFLATAAQADGPHPYVPLGPANYCGIQAFAHPNRQGASATVVNGQPIIIVDPSQVNPGPWGHFVAAHECAHHALGHTLPSGMWFRNTQYWATAAQELTADCWAAQRVGRAAAVVVAQRMAAAQGHHRGGPGYPTGVQRARNIRRCVGLQ